MFIRSLLVLFIAGTVFWPTLAGAVLSIKLGVVTKPGSAQNIVAEKFKALIEERSQGTIRVKIFHSKSIGNETEILQQIQMNTIQMGIINALELEAENKRLALAEILDTASANSSRAGILERDIERLDTRIAELRGELTQTSDSSISLARTGAELRIAETELATRQLILQESIGAVEAARLEVNRQTRYLSLGVAPVAPVEATYPRKVEGTALAFVVFFAIYILLSLTVSILREQVSV